MFGHPVTGRIERPAMFGCPARGTTVQSMSRMDISTADTAGKLKVIAEAAVTDGSLFFKLQHNRGNKRDERFEFSTMH